MACIQESEHWPLIEAQQWDFLEAILTDFTFLEAKVAGGLVFALVEDFAAALARLPTDRPGRRLVELIGRAVRRDAAFLARHRGALFQCLWNLGSWHAGDGLRALLETWRERKQKRDPGFAWVRSLRPPFVPLDGPLLAVLPLPTADTRNVSLAFSDDGESLIASFGAARLPMAWDVTTGHPLPSEGTSRPRDSRLSPDGRLRVQTGSWDDPVRLVDAASGHQVAELPTGDEVIFRAVAFSPDG